MSSFDSWLDALTGNPKNDDSNKELQEITKIESTDTSSVDEVIDSILENEDSLVIMVKGGANTNQMEFLHHPYTFGRRARRNKTPTTTKTKYVALHGTSSTARATPVQIDLEAAFQVVETKAPGWTMLRNFDTKEKVLQATTPKKLNKYSLRHAKILPPSLARALIQSEDHSPAGLFVEALKVIEKQDAEGKDNKEEGSTYDSASPHCKDIFAYLWQAAQETSDLKEIEFVDASGEADVADWSEKLHQQYIKPEKLAAEGNQASSSSLKEATKKDDDNTSTKVETAAAVAAAEDTDAAIPPMPPLTGQKVSDDKEVLQKVEQTPKKESTETEKQPTDAAQENSALLEAIKKKPPKSRSWDDSYSLLVEYKKEFGDCNVRRDWKIDPSLAEWARQQRRKQKTLTPEQFSKLDSLGFVWGHALQERNNQLWEESYKRLKAYKDVHGTANPPRLAKDDENDDLSRWCVTQRQNYKRGLLSEERKNKLESIGFVWTMRKDYTNKGRPKDEEQWKKQFENMVELKKQKGHCNPPKVYPPAPGLHNWAYTQRKAYKEGRLDENRKKMLEKIGFIWKLGDAQREELWMDSFNKLKEFHTAHGHLEIPRSGPTSDTALLKWLRRQREAYRCEKLPENRKTLLDDIGFDFQGDLSARATLVEEQNWKDSFDALKALKEKKGDVNEIGQSDSTELYRWCKRQQKLHKEGKLISSRKALLDEIGLKFEEKKPKAPTKKASRNKGAPDSSKKRKTTSETKPKTAPGRKTKKKEEEEEDVEAMEHLAEKTDKSEPAAGEKDTKKEVGAKPEGVEEQTTSADDDKPADEEAPKSGKRKSSSEEKNKDTQLDDAKVAVNEGQSVSPEEDNDEGSNIRKRPRRTATLGAGDKKQQKK